MLLAQGDLWSAPCDYVVITTNASVRRDGHAVMGRGCAKEASDRFPELSYWLAQKLKRDGNHVFLSTQYKLFTFPVKVNWYDDAVLHLVRQSTQELAVLCRDVSLFEGKHIKVAMPRPGCGAGKLRWSKVEPILRNLLDDNFTVYDHGR